MTLNIRIADHNDQLKWDNYVLKSPNGLAYHLFAWKEAVEKAYGFKGYYLIAEENNFIKGVLPLIHHKNPVSCGYAYFSSLL